MTRDPELRYTAEGQTAVCRFSIAIDRGKDREGNDRGADFPNIVVFGKTAENCEKYLAKGRKVGIAGHLQTGSYTNKDGAKVYTTDVIADRVEFIDWGEKQQENAQATDADGFMNIPDQLYDELPFS
jgi:single-strand DNA-binding protein